jgi:hypothetical protein
VIDLACYFSVEANRRLFITADGKPTNPALWPSGGQVQFYGAVDDWHTNKGTGGGFTLTGALTAGTGPVAIPQRLASLRTHPGSRKARAGGQRMIPPMRSRATFGR